MATNPAKLAYWRDHLIACQQSGLTRAEYCTRQGLARSTFGLWQRRCQQADAEHSGFVPVTVSTAAPVSTIEIDLTNGRSVRLSGAVDVAWLAGLLSALERA